MIKHTLTKKQQLVLCAMYVESLGRLCDPRAQAFHESGPRPGGRQILICLDPYFTCSPNTINYLQSFGLVGHWFTEWSSEYFCLTPDGEELAKTLLKVLS